MTNKFIIVPALMLSVLGGGALLGYANLASADVAADGTQPQKGMHMKMKGMGRGHHGVMGEVTAVNGTAITVTGMDGKSYTVTADKAEVTRVVTGSLTDIQVGDRIGVHGTVSGTTVTAERIMDDVPEKPMKPAAPAQ